VTLTAEVVTATRITTTIIIITVIRTVNQENAEDQIIGEVAGVRVHLIARKELIRVSAVRRQRKHHYNKKLMNKIVRMNPSIHAGRNRHNKMIVSEDQTIMAVDSVENGINVVQRLIILYRYHVMNVLNRSCLVPRIRVSILANTKTFPWRRRDSKFLNTFRLLMTSS
jgi:hypothetical protein